MKLFHPKVIHHLTTAYYNSLYLTSVFIRLYITGLFVVSYGMPYGGSHRRSRPPYILTSSPDWLFQTSPFSGWGVTEQLGCKQRDFCYGCFCITYGWMTVITCISGLHFRNHVDLWAYIWWVLVLPWDWSQMNETTFLFRHHGQNAERTVTKVSEGHATFWKHDGMEKWKMYPLCFFVKTNKCLFTVCILC